MRDLLHALDIVLLGSIAWAAALGAVLALGLVLTVAGSIHAYRRHSR